MWRNTNYPSRISRSAFLSNIDPLTGKLYLIDLEDVLDLKAISLEDPETQMLLEYNPKDYLKSVSSLTQER